MIYTTNKDVGEIDIENILIKEEDKNYTNLKLFIYGQCKEYIDKMAEEVQLSEKEMKTPEKQDGINKEAFFMFIADFIYCGSNGFIDLMKLEYKKGEKIKADLLKARNMISNCCLYHLKKSEAVL